MRTLALLLLSFPLALCAAESTTQSQRGPVIPQKDHKPLVVKTKPCHAISQENTWHHSRLPIDMQGFFGGIDFLWWKPSENGLDYALRKDFAVFQNSAFSASAIDGLAGKMKAATFGSAPGFRLDAGYRTPHDAFEVFAEFTWFQSLNNKQSTQAPKSGMQPALAGTFPEFVSSSAAFLVNRASSQCGLQYRVGDIGLARRFEVSRYVLFRTFATLRGAWMERNWLIKYTCLSSGQSSKHRSKWKFDGAGFQFGVDTDWYLGYGFNAFALGSFSALYGEHQDRIRSKSTFDLIRPLQRSTLEDHRGVTATELQVGFAWGRAWEVWSLKILAAWEINNWYNLAEHYRVQIPVATAGINTEKVRNLTTSILTVQGLTLGVDINY